MWFFSVRAPMSAACVEWVRALSKEVDVIMEQESARSWKNEAGCVFSGVSQSTHMSFKREIRRIMMMKCVRMGQGERIRTKWIDICLTCLLNFACTYNLRGHAGILTSAELVAPKRNSQVAPAPKQQKLKTKLYIFYKLVRHSLSLMPFAFWGVLYKRKTSNTIQIRNGPQTKIY